jgi:hypothetical protein
LAKNLAFLLENIDGKLKLFIISISAHVRPISVLIHCLFKSGRNSLMCVKSSADSAVRLQIVGHFLIRIRAFQEYLEKGKEIVRKHQVVI